MWNQNRTRQIETLQRAATEQTAELNLRINQLAGVFRRAEAEAIRDRNKAKAINQVIESSNVKVLSQSRKLTKITEQLERARRSTKDDQGVLRQLDDERKRLGSSITEEEVRLAALTGIKEKVLSEVIAFKDVMQQKQRQLEMTSTRLGDTATEIRRYHEHEQKLESSIVRDEYRLKRLEAELLKQHAVEAGLRLRGGRANAVSRARERAAFERQVRNASRARALRELAAADYSTEAALSSNFYKPFEGTYSDFPPSIHANPRAAGSTQLPTVPPTARVKHYAAPTVFAKPELSSDGDNVPLQVAAEENEVYGFENGEDAVSTAEELSSMETEGDEDDNGVSGLTPLNEAPPPPGWQPRDRGEVSKRFANLQNMWDATTASGSATLARKMKRELDDQLHYVDGAVFTKSE
jgi:hypothetical protein